VDQETEDTNEDFFRVIEKQAYSQASPVKARLGEDKYINFRTTKRDSKF